MGIHAAGDGSGEGDAAGAVAQLQSATVGHTGQPGILEPPPLFVIWIKMSNMGEVRAFNWLLPAGGNVPGASVVYVPLPERAVWTQSILGSVADILYAPLCIYLPPA